MALAGHLQPVLGDLKAFSIIPGFQDYLLAVFSEEDLDPICLGVLDDIVQALLVDPVERNQHGFREQFAILIGREFDLELGVLRAEVNQVRLDGFFQTKPG